MKIELKANQQGQIYLPKLLRDEWGNEYFLIPDAEGGVLFRRDVKAKNALRSLDVIRKELEHRAEIEEENHKCETGLCQEAPAK
jgi:bifunctional DNA-binding transcriptional regulator/antitoxin component of YhaV-PrlF toxin-antitoxin module